jgi:hypothetical protein
MGNDEEDFGPPPEEFAEDFVNFDPETYMKGRGAGRPPEADDDQPEQGPQDSDDFSSFDPQAYLRKRYSQQGRPDLSTSPYNREAQYTDRRRQRAFEQGPQRRLDRETRGERRGCFGRLFVMGETFGLLREILAEAGPLVRVVGCIVVVLLFGICTIGYLLISSLSRHP